MPILQATGHLWNGGLEGMAADLRPQSIYMASVVVTWLFLLQMPQFTVAFIHIIQVQIKSPFSLHDPKPSDCAVTILTA